MNGIIILGGDNDVETKTYSNFSILTKKKNTWKYETLKPFLFSRSCFGVIYFDNFLFIIGGFDGNRSIPSVECYDFVLKEWTQYPCLRYRRSSCGSVCIQNKMYIVGGVAKNKIIDSIEEFNLFTGEWKIITKDIIPTSGGGVVSFQNNLYTFGGYSETKNISTKLCCYNVVSDTWRILKPMINERASFGYCLFYYKNNPIIVVVGGLANGNILRKECEYYDISTNEWVEMGELNMSRKYCSVVSYQNKLYIIGGTDASKCNDIVESYDFETRKWTVEYNLNTTVLCGQGICSIEGQTLKKNRNKIIINENIVWTGSFQNKKRQGLFKRTTDKGETSIYFLDNVIVSKEVYDFQKRVKKLKVPREFLCPISYEIMKEPTITMSGNTYDRENIEKWLVNKKTDPLTNNVISSNLVPNTILKKIIHNFIQNKFSLKK